jgi:hypothetical protein
MLIENKKNLDIKTLDSINSGAAFCFYESHLGKGIYMKTALPPNGKKYAIVSLEDGEIEEYDRSVRVTVLNAKVVID